MKPFRTLTLAAGMAVALALPFAAEERIHTGVNASIRQEGLADSQIMRTLAVLSDRYGPRLTGTPNLKASGEWAIRQLESWGLANGRMEPWSFGYPGWANEFASGAMVSPAPTMLAFEVLAWTPGTRGAAAGSALHLVPPDRPTETELLAFFEALRPRITGAIVLVGRHRSIPVSFDPPVKRRPDELVRQQFEPAPPPSAGARAQPRAPGGRGTQPPPGLSPGEVSRRIDRFLVEHGALVRINDAGRPHGQIAAYSNRTYDISQTVPTVVLRNEDFGRITRLLAAGTPVELRFEIVNRTYPEGATAYNAVAEIPGTDLKEEVVMLGAHLDSWHSATGATDNAIGCAVMMEAVRILRRIGAQPRRTIRIALWSGEEQGLLGSRAYVARHFGTFEKPAPEFDRLSAYLNIDHGTGRIRGAAVFGPPAAAHAMRELLSPFEDFGVLGTLAVSSRALGGTDHTSFTRAGLPGINFIQDPIEYASHTHHTNLDTYERIVEADARQSAIVVASVVYHLAMRDARLPRFGTPEMPPLRGATD